MVNNTSRFGCDSNRNMVTAEDSVWQAYLTSHKDATPFRTRTFQFFNEFLEIYGKDRAIEKDAQAPADILKEIQNEGNHRSPNVGTEDNFHTHNVGIEDMELSSVPPMSSS